MCYNLKDHASDHPTNGRVVCVTNRIFTEQVKGAKHSKSTAACSATANNHGASSYSSHFSFYALLKRVTSEEPVIRSIIMEMVKHLVRSFKSRQLIV